MINMLYSNFYILAGIRTSSHLANPPMIPMDKLNLPKNSILHCVEVSPVENGPASEDFIFRNIQKPIMTGHVIENGDFKGNPKKLGVSPDALIRAYHTKHRRFRIMKSLENASRDPTSLIVYNYGLLPKIYKYMVSFYTNYNRWWNTQAAMWKNIDNIASMNDRQHFVICNLPEVLPSVAILQYGCEPVSQKIVNIFNTPEMLMVLELWKWFGLERADSVINNVSEKNLSKVNIVYQESGVWFVMNLGRMNKWRVATKEELEANPEANKKGIQPEQLQRRFLFLLVSFMRARIAAQKLAEAEKKAAEAKQQAANVETSTVNNEPVSVADDKTAVVVQTTEMPSVDKETGAVVSKPALKEISVDLSTTELPDDADTSIAHDDKLDESLNRDLAELEVINAKRDAELKEAEVSFASIADIYSKNPTLEEGVEDVCNKLADSGSISAADYRKLAELSKKYRVIQAPNKKQTLAEFIEIKPEDVVVEESHHYKDIPTVLDKTMLKSALHDFDTKYITQVLEKHVAASVLAIQNAGVAVTDYNVERVDTILGSHDEYTVNVKPVEGMASILRFKLPVVDENGVYSAGGTRYRLRKQRGDIPIRKINSSTVALTSYYGKVFVARSSKKVNDYGQWLRNSIMVKGLDHNDESVTDIKPINVFDNEADVPRLYSTLAMGYREFTVTTHLEPGGKTNKLVSAYLMSFDYKKRPELFGDEAIKTYEKNGSIIVGHKLGDDQTYLIMDKNGSLYIGNKGNVVDFCTIEDLLQLDINKAPIDFAELRVLGKTIPIALVLCYEFGLNNLLKLMKLNPRRVPLGTRVNLSPEEYAVAFNDETLVFLRDDKRASLIFAGFNEYHRAIRQYSSSEFDKRGVYLNVLESNGMSARYLREIDLLFQMFVDPITKGILMKMHEPLTFHGLLLRSCDLLMSDKHPQEVDPEFMRIKGYERFAGTVYNEIVKALRVHNGKAGKATKQLDLNPYAVWIAIKQDPSVMLVNDINPIENLKEEEAVTFNGNGGRDARSMVKSSRIYHRNDMGTISESTVDNKDVGTNIFTSADPQFDSLYGTSKRYDKDKTGHTALLSTSALISPFSDVDD